MRLSRLQTPALVVERADLEHNVASMAETCPGNRLRPHVKAHKSTRLAGLQAAAGHRSFTCATIREVEGMAAAGFADDLLLANEVLDATRLGVLAVRGARITVAVDSEATVEAAASGKVAEVLIDVNVGLPRCGCEPGRAGPLADLARRRGLVVRGVMGYEGHAVGLEDRGQRVEQTATAMSLLRQAHEAVGGDVVSAGATGTYDINAAATEIQAGSYLLMDTAYAKLGLPFRNALTILATVISVNPGGWAVADCGLKALGMDHGNPSLLDGGVVWYCSDEHVTFSAADGAPPYEVGQRVRLVPAHIDPTVAYHELMHLVAGDEVLDSWPVDLRGW